MSATLEVVLVLPNGGTPNTFDLFARAPLYANEFAATYTGNINGIMTTPTAGATPTTGQSLFATAPGATLYNPKGSRDLLDD